MPRLSLSVWALLALMVGGALGCLAPAFGADTPIIVVNTTTGRQQQAQAADNAFSAGGIKSTDNCPLAQKPAAVGWISAGDNNTGAGALRVFGGSTQKGWQVGSNITLADTLEMTPATVGGGTTFTSPVATLSPTTFSLTTAATGGMIIAPTSGITLTNLSTTDATSVGTASVVFNGGLGVVKRNFLGTIGSTFKGNVLAGVQDGTADTAGAVGEVLSGSAASTAVASTGNVGNVCSVTLTPGAWMITGSFTINQGATGLTTGSVVNCSIVTTTATNGTQGTTMNQDSALLAANGFKMMSAPTVTANISATTTYYLTEQCTFGGGSPTVSGKITAVRIR